MPRKLLLAASALVTMALAFAAASYAVERQGEPRLRSNLPAADLPAIALAENEAFAINNLIGPHVDRFGITRESYANVRLIAETAAGPLYLIPGSRELASCSTPERRAVIPEHPVSPRSRC